MKIEEIFFYTLKSYMLYVNHDSVHTFSNFAINSIRRLKKIRCMTIKKKSIFFLFVKFVSLVFFSFRVKMQLKYSLLYLIHNEWNTVFFQN